MPSFLEKPNLRWRIFLPVFALATVAGLAFVFARPAIYASTARMQVDPPPGQEGEANLPTAAAALTSGEVLDKVAQQVSGSGGVVTTEMLRGTLSATPIAGTNVMELRGEGGDRELLPQILGAWIEAYRRVQSEAFGQSSTEAVDESKRVLEQLSEDLSAKRRHLDEFRKANNIVSLEREENQISAQMRGLNTSLSDARNRELTAEGKLKAVRDNVAAGKPIARQGDRALIAELDKRASELRDKVKEAENDYTTQYLALDPKYKTLRANLARLEQQLARERKYNADSAQQDAEEELAGARQTVLRLETELAGRKREMQAFTARFAEHTALVNELKGLEESVAAAKQTLAKAEREQKGRGPRLTVLSQPSQPERPVRPDYWRDALIAVLGSGGLGMIAVLFVEFFKRSGVTPQEPAASQPIIQIAYPPNIMLNQAAPALELPAQRVPETALAAPAARELSALEVGALWDAAVPDTRVIIAGLLNGLSPAELSALRYQDIDLGAQCLHLAGSSGRSVALHNPLERLLAERKAAGADGFALAAEGGEPLSSGDLEGHIACAACDAGLANPVEVSSETLRHTYFAYLIRQGARLADIGEFIGAVPPAAFREYGRLSPPGPGLPLDQIDPVYPALRPSALRSA